MRSATGLLTRGSLPRRLPGFAPVASWRRSVSPYSGGTVPDSHRVPSPCSVVAGEPIIGRCAALSSETGFPSSPGRRVIFAFSSVPDLGTGLGGWDLVLRKLAHAAEYAILGALLVRATGRAGPAFGLGVLYAVERRDPPDVRRRAGTASPVDVAIDAVGVAVGIALWQSRASAAPRVTATRAARHRARRDRGHAAALVGLARIRRAACSRSSPAALPVDRGEAADALDRAGAGNWRTLLERFAEDHAPAYLRRDARDERSAAVARVAAASRWASSPTRRSRSRASRSRSSAPPRRVSVVESRRRARSTASSPRSAPTPSSCVRGTTS